MAAPRVGEQLVVQDPLEGPEQDSGQVALVFFSMLRIRNLIRIRIILVTWIRIK
jgi:hypothetical protein